MCEPLITVAVPSYNQGRFLDEALASIFRENVPVEVFVVDGGSTDGSVEVIRNWEVRLKGWRSRRDEGQAAAINEAIAMGRAPFVCWLNSDDWFVPGGLERLLAEIQSRPDVPAVYGRAWNVVEESGKRSPVWVERFSERRLAMRCIISQPATLIRRSAWEAIGGVDARLHMAMDYDFWWRLYKSFGALGFVDSYVAVNREHRETKTRRNRRKHYAEAMEVVARYYGRVPLKWWLYQPYSVWFKSLFG
ncbi:glycosyltransferase [Azoarcus sp. TTM-91]|uniref:glycosyltransferase family 2 protein n=1 Tax=Azoarcus sp. TTM-91 TaxID=2691581 RepID=UPI00145F9108|nr:glycosyltransferase family 2 protein [Azoarcus sp. TTM-91]NMG33882.1 glycosyltransferase [Azoarcus sp. TTM-91]